MGFFRRNTPRIEKPTDPVVTDIKKRTHQAAKEATENAERLNELFRQNGITLNILRSASGARHEH